MEDEEKINRDKKIKNIYNDDMDYDYFSEESYENEFEEYLDESYNEETYVQIHRALMEYVDHVNQPLCEFLTINSLKCFLKFF